MTPTNRWLTRLGSGVWVLALAAPLLAVAWDALVYIGNGTDLFSYQEPLRKLLHDWLRDGRWSTWNPGELGGLPVHATMQLGLAYPPNLIASFLSPWHASEILMALHLLGLGAGAVYLAGAWAGSRATWPAGVAVAALLVGGGPTWGHVFAGHVSLIEAWAWTPWIWGLALQAVRQRRLRPAVWSGAALGLQVLAGHPQATFLGLCGLAVALLALVLDPGDSAGAGDKGNPASRLKHWPASVLALLVLAVAGAVGLALSAVQWWPTWLFAEHSNRSMETPLQIALAYGAPARTLLTAVAPAGWGGTGPRLGGFAYHETVAFVGAAGLTLAALGAVRSGLRGAVLAAGALACLLLSVGQDGLLLPALVDLVPGFGSFRVPGRWLLPAVALLALLAAEALTIAAKDSGRSKTKSVLGFGVLGGLALALLGLGVTLRADGGWWAAGLDAKRSAGAGLDGFAAGARLGLFAASGALAAALVAWGKPSWHKAISWGLVGVLGFEVLRFASSHVQPDHQQAEARVRWGTQELQALVQAVGRDHRLATAAALRQANWPATAGLAGAGAYEPVVPLLSNAYGNRLSGRAATEYGVMFQVRRPSVWLDRLAVSHLLLDADDGQTRQAFADWPEVQKFDSGRVLRRNPAPMPRFSVAAQVRVVPDNTAAVEQLAGLPTDTVLLDRALPHTSGATGTVEAVEDAPDRLVVRATVTQPAVVVVRDALENGWTVQVDGRAATAARADGLFRAVAVPAGTHLITWEFRAPGLRAGGAASALTVLMLTGWAWLRRRRAEKGAPAKGTPAKNPPQDKPKPEPTAGKGGGRKRKQS